MADNPARFLEGNLLRHVAVMSLTASLGLMAVFLVDLLDLFFISILGQAELAAAVGYAAAILFFTTSAAIGMAIATGARVARALGEGDREEARERASTALVFGLVLGVLLAVLVWMFIPDLVALLGATDETADLADSYLRIVVPTLPFMMLGMSGGAILRAHGRARAAMMATIWGGLANGILDPILIFGFGLDLTGAAVASAVSRLVIAVAALQPAARVQGGFAVPSLARLGRDLRPVLAIALPAVLTQLATPLGQAYVTRAVAGFGEAAVAGVAVIGRLTPFAFGLVFALSGAVGPIIGQNDGAGRADRVRETYRSALWFTGAVVVLISALLFLLRPAIADAFSARGLARDLVFLFCGPLALAFFFNGVIFVSNAAFNNLGRPFYSTWINWGRHTLGTIPFVLIGAAWMGAPGVLIGQAVGGAIFAAIALLLAVRVMRGGGGDMPAFTRQARLVQLFNGRR
ncbi:MAG: MATE family efflux transporter [Marinibacterium sp.]